MARLQHFGWESKNDPTFGGVQQVSRGRVRHDPSYSGVLTGAYVVSLKPQPILDASVSSYLDSYTRFYLRIVTNAAVQRRLFGVHGSEGGDDAVVLELTTAGALKVYNWGNWVAVGGGNETPSTGQLLGTSAALTVGQWYRIEVNANFTADTISVRIDGVAMSLSAASGTSYGIKLAGNSGVQWNLGKTVTSLYAYEVDDACVDSSTWPDAGDIVSLGITGVGTTNSNWTIGGAAITDTNIQQAVTVPSNPAIPAAPYLLTNSVAGGDISFKLQTFASVGITSADTIYGVKISVSAGSNSGGGVKFYVSKNGVKTYAPTFIDINVSQSVKSYYWPAADLGGLVDTDVVEVGLLKDGTATATPCGGVHVDVETSSCSAVTSTNTAIQTATGSFTGTDISQAINCGFKPDFLLVYGKQGSNTTGVRIFWEGMFGVGGSGPGPQVTAQAFVHVNRRTLAATLGFDAVGNSTLVNASGTTYYWLAISDPSSRLMDRGLFTKDEANDVWAQSLQSGSFVPEMLWVLPLQKGTAGANFTARFSSHAAALSSHLSSSTADATDLIASMGAGTFTLGNTIDKTNKGIAFAAFQSTPITTKVCYISSYTGNASANRVISVTLGASLGFVLVVPTNAEKRMFKDTNMAAAESHQFDDDTTKLTAGAGSLIVAMTSSSFTVSGGASAGLNTSGVVYNVFALAAPATDLASVTNVIQQCDTNTTDAHTTGDTLSTYTAKVKSKPFPVANLNQAFGFKSAALLGSAGSKVLMKVITDFGLETKSVAVDMTATGSETHVLKQIDNLSGSSAYDIQVQFEDDPAAASQWRLYQAELETAVEE